MAKRVPEWITEIRFYNTTPFGNGMEATGSLTIAGAVYVKFTVFKTKDNTLRVVLPSGNAVTILISFPIMMRKHLALLFE